MANLAEKMKTIGEPWLEKVVQARKDVDKSFALYKRTFQVGN